jgi:hypothetical protein
MDSVGGGPVVKKAARIHHMDSVGGGPAPSPHKG